MSGRQIKSSRCRQSDLKDAILLQPVPLYEVCRETINIWKCTGTSKNRQTHLSSDNPDTSVLVQANDLILQQVLFNLLENAGHRSPAGCSIMVRLIQKEPDLAEGMVVVQIIDQGAGVAEDKRPQASGTFRAGRRDGAGLGLTLDRCCIEQMGGSMKIWNNSPPPGCTVEVRVPLYREL